MKHLQSSPGHQLTLHTKFLLSRTNYTILTYLMRQMLHLPVALNPKEAVSNIFKSVLDINLPLPLS